MKVSRLQIAVAIVLAALAGALGAVAANRWHDQRQPGGLHEFVHERLDPDAAQLRRLDALEARFAIENAQHELALRQANARLAAAMDSEHEYGPRVTAAIDGVHDAMGDLQKSTVRHVFAMRQILDEEQRREFDQQVARSLTGATPE
ncbi:periplasmic heavy metal sensor [Pelagerythrobacter sp.]|uniref:periplasmic heavy metal sensor n=1 Tax=Pelagerythrobacter sp. TaxID=2800702 RepID=UPI0035B2B814